VNFPLSRILWQAHPLRAVIEAVLITSALLSLSLSKMSGRVLSTQQPVLVALTAIGLGVLCALICAMRARLPTLPWPAALIADGGLALLLMVTLGVALWLLLGLLRPYPTTVGLQIRALLIIVAGLSAANFFVARLAFRLWQIWQVTRQQRLIWAIVHAHLLTLLAILSLFLLVQGLRYFLSGPPISLTTEGTEGATTLFWLSTTLFTMVGTTILAIPLLMVIMGLAAVVSYFTARPLTRRLETLAQAVSSFRREREDPQLAIAGQDEIAQLSADFQAMAVELSQTLSDLQTERDTVAGLLQTRRELMASVSHELRTPVATMRSYLESLLTHWEDAPPPHLRHDLETITGEVIRLQALIDDLFTLSQAEVGQLTLRPEPTDLTPLIQRVVSIASPLAWQASRIQVTSDLPEDLPLAVADAGRLEQVLRNLVHNGVRHTPPGGIVAITAQAQPKQVWIEVRDTGEGIPPETLPHIWERFYRGSGKEGHESRAGLGLALVKELSEAMGGTVTVESVLGQGSHFTIRLPRG
jgi:signal transduction histidine kinase